MLIMSLVSEYLDFHEKYEKQYGKSVVLMQVGIFYEMYSLKESSNDTYKKGADLDGLSKLLNILKV